MYTYLCTYISTIVFASLEVYIPVNPLTKEQFVATMLHNKIVSHAETATRLFETLEHDQTGTRCASSH